MPGIAPQTTYGYADLMGLWVNAGGSRVRAAVAAAIAMAESSGRALVTSSNPDGGVNVGLWQLDTKGKGAGHTVAELQDPSTNARVAVQASQDGSDWSAWETWVTGAYKKFLHGGTQPDTNVPSPSGSGDPVDTAVGDIFHALSLPFDWLGGAASGIGSAVIGLAAPFVKIAGALDWFLHPSHWIRLLAGVAGGVLVFGGVFQMTHVGGS